MNHRNIRATAHGHWRNLPEHYRLEGRLNTCDEPPAVRDFVLGARLDHLHVLFLLALALARPHPEDSLELVTIAADMLSLVVEAIMQKGTLVTSGTSLVWKVSYYGLSAAGVLCLWLVNKPGETSARRAGVSKMVRDLTVLVAEIEAGLLVRPSDSNYKVQEDASRTIQALLDRLLFRGLSQIPEPGDGAQQQGGPPAVGSDHLPGWSAVEGWPLYDFESDFWTTLGDHPFLVDMNC